MLRGWTVFQTLIRIVENQMTYEEYRFKTQELHLCEFINHVCSSRAVHTEELQKRPALSFR